jgi:hypothetical protein
MCAIGVRQRIELFGVAVAQDTQRRNVIDDEHLAAGAAAAAQVHWR